METALLLWLERLYAAAGNVTAWTDAFNAQIPDGIPSHPLVSRHRNVAERLHQELVALSAKLQAFAHALDQLPHPVIVVDVGLRILIIQQRARLILERKDGLSLEGNSLVATRHDVTIQLRDVVVSALEDNVRLSMFLDRPSDGRSIPLLVAPLPCGTITSTLTPAAMVVIADPELGATVDQAMLRQLYGFTRAEANLAVLLSMGRTLEEAADELCVSVNTVRTHLQRIFLKTDTSRQATLLRTLLLGPAAIP